MIGWNIAGYLLYAGLLAVGLTEVWYSLFFGMATDACHDSACDASYHVRPTMLTMWLGVGLVLTSTLIVMLLFSARGRVVFGWPVAGGRWRAAGPGAGVGAGAEGPALKG